ncbi:MAG: YbfB/YjiJ family MFS transporter [Rhizobacter sp.]
MTTSRAHPQVLWVAAALALAAAVSLGLARFSYALLLPPMRADLGWSYLTAGAMNTVNAAGYLVGALLMPAALRRYPARRLLLVGSALAAALLALHGVVQSDEALYALRLFTGVASAATFVSGGLLAARLTGAPSGLVLGLYYGGTGIGIILSALLVPPLVALQIDHAWRWAWGALGAVALLATVITARATGALGEVAGAVAQRERFGWQRFVCGLGSYFLFGLGYIGYMTFVVTLLREQQLGGGFITVFYATLGVGVVASSWIWAGLLQRHRGGRPMAVLNVLVAVATVLPVLSAHPVAVFVSGALFGAVFLSIVASTTALVRHNLPPAAWPAGIAAFTTVFAAGQIVGPSLVGWLADGPGGLRAGLAVSAAVLAAGGALAAFQRALPLPEKTS